MSNSSPLVPGGGLAAHEIAGGHTLTRHVGKTEVELLARLAREPIPIASSFTDRGVAETAITEAIDANQITIASWLSSSGDKLELPLYAASGSVGTSLIRTTTSAVASQKVQVVLRRDSSLPLGYYILTAFPQP